MRLERYFRISSICDEYLILGGSSWDNFSSTYLTSSSCCSTKVISTFFSDSSKSLSSSSQCDWNILTSSSPCLEINQIWDNGMATFSFSSLSNFSLRKRSSWVLRKSILFLASSAEEKSCLSRHILSYSRRRLIMSWISAFPIFSLSFSIQLLIICSLFINNIQLKPIIIMHTLTHLLHPRPILTIRCSFAKQIFANTTKSTALSNPRSRQLANFKKELAQREPVRTDALYQQFHYRDVYKRINIQMESFFFERPYTLENFNFLLNLIAEQSPKDWKLRVNEVLHKMNLLSIQPNVKTYNSLIKAAGNASQIKEAQLYFEEACRKFMADKFLYTSLMQTYAKNNDPEMAMGILREMEEKGLEPDLPVYTTLINSFRKGRKLEKCWQIYKKVSREKIEVDETFTGVMLKVFAAVFMLLSETHDAEKALKIYRENISEKSIKPMVETVNSYFKALSTRRDYSAIVIDKFLAMVENGEIVNEETAIWALRACSTNGSVKSAGQILTVMRMKDLEIGKGALTTLLKIYASACSSPNLQEEYREVVMTDCWKILEAINQKGQVSTNVLNNMLQIYANSINHEEIDGLILPLYQKFGQEYNMYTFELLIRLYFKLGEFSTAARIWNQMNNKIKQNEEKFMQKWEPSVQDLRLRTESKNEDLRPTFNAIHCYLEIGIKLMDMNQVLEALELFKKIKRPPKNATLKFLGNLKDLPEEIRVSLMDFKIQFGQAKESKKQLPLIKDPQNK